MSLTIHCKYKYFDSTIQRAEDRQQKFYFYRLPFAVNREFKLTFTAETAKIKLLPSVFSPLYSRIEILVFAVNMKRIEKQR